MFESVLIERAREFYDTLSAEDQADVDRVLRLLELNPWTDDVTKFAVMIRGVGMGVYDDDHWEIVYRVVDDRFIEVLGISRVGG